MNKTFQYEVFLHEYPVSFVWNDGDDQVWSDEDDDRGKYIDLSVRREYTLIPGEVFVIEIVIPEYGINSSWCPVPANYHFAFIV